MIYMKHLRRECQKFVQEKKILILIFNFYINPLNFIFYSHYKVRHEGPEHHVQTVKQQLRRYGEEMPAVNQYVTHVDCTTNYIM